MVTSLVVELAMTLAMALKKKAETMLTVMPKIVWVTVVAMNLTGAAGDDASGDTSCEKLRNLCRQYW